MNAYDKKGCERKRLYTNACDKERKNRPQIPVTKKERTYHKCLWQRKKDQTTNAGDTETKQNSCLNQASKQLTPNERNKTAETTSKPQTVAYLQA